MEKILKTLKVAIIILIIILVSVISIWGIFVKDKGVWENIIPDYKYGMDIDGTRELRYALDDSEEEKYVYVDDNGNVISEVLEDGSAVDEDEENSDETSENSEETFENTDETQENTEDSEEEIPYKKEKRTIKANEDSELTKENFEEAKKKIQARLKSAGIESYDIRLDDVTGKIVIETNNDDTNVDNIEDLVGQVGKFQIVDYQNGVLLMDNSNIKKASAVYSTSNSSYNVYLQIEFDKEGKEKLKNISNEYVETKVESEESEETDTTDESTETDSESESEEETDEEEEEETTTKYIMVTLDGEDILQTYFGEELSNGVLQLSLDGSTTDYDEFVENYKKTQNIAYLLNDGYLPISYELETDNFVKSSITDNTKRNVMIFAIVVVAIISIIFIVKYKGKGALASILSLGFVSVLSIVARYTNVLITVNSFISYGIVVIMNYALMSMVLKNLNDENGFNNSMKKFYLSIIPVIILAFVFIFQKYAMINSIGMVMFWGVILIALYNMIFSKPILRK